MTAPGVGQGEYYGTAISDRRGPPEALVSKKAPKRYTTGQRSGSRTPMKAPSGRVELEVHMQARWLGAIAGILVGFATTQVAAHHAFSAEFDAKRPVKLKGTVTRMEWINPHSWIHVDVKDASGKVTPWMVEGGAPNALLRRGFTKNSLQIGTEVSIEGFQAKDGSKRANGRDITLPDGTKLFVGSSGTGAPRDGRDPTEK